jgi:glycosyltransferase involved in cell wall biosynthesis
VRVLLVHGWHPIEGGAEAYFTALRHGLAATGDEVRLLVSTAGSAANGTADYMAHGTTRLSRQAFLQIANPSAVAAARRALREFRPDVAVVGVFADFLSPAIFEPLQSVPTVLVVVDYKVVCPNSRKLLRDGTICTQRHGTICLTGGCMGLAHWLRDRLRYALIARAVSRVQRIVTCSAYLEHVLAADGLEAEHLDWPVRGPHAGFVRAPAARPSFLYVGRLSVEKGVANLLHAFSEVSQQFPEATLRIGGEGPEEAALRMRAQGERVGARVSFLGWRTSDELEREFGAAWALLAPSVWAEPLGVGALEAVVRGVPVIASRTGGFAETIRPGQTGLLVPNGDVEALARAMLDVASGRAFPDHAVAEDARLETALRHDLGRHVEALRHILARSAGLKPH